MTFLSKLFLHHVQKDPVQLDYKHLWRLSSSIAQASLGVLLHIMPSYRVFSVLDKRHMTVALYEEFSKLNTKSLMVFAIRVAL